MSLTDKVIKNTYYFILSQIIGFIFPLLLTPFIIGYIGDTSYGIYALVLGFAGIFGLFDLSVSSSFIKFISEHYNKKEFNELNSVINTGIIFYTLFSLVCCIIGIVFMDTFISLLNIKPEFMEIARLAYIVSLAAFFVTNSFGIFNSVLISLQKMYLTSILGTLLSVLNFIAVIILLLYGYGLKELLILHITVITISILISYFTAKIALPEMKLGIGGFKVSALKKMTNFGMQMQVSKLASFASDKYDEYLLAFFSVISNVTYYNISTKLVRIGKFLPFQLVPQVAPVAAELNAKEQQEKIKELYIDTTKYLTVLALPIFTYIFIFSDIMVNTWMGPGFEISSHILRILVIGQLINMIFSAPGNSITPNIGYPKYQMYEGLIFLGFNLILSYLFIKYYGIVGAAIGNSISTSIASLYVFYVSAKFFGKKHFPVLSQVYLKPFFASLVAGVISFGLFFIISKFLINISGRLEGIAVITATVIAFIIIYSAVILNVNYVNDKDKKVLIKILSRALPLKQFIKFRNRRFAKSNPASSGYNGETVSLFIITHNRREFTEQCINALLPTLKNINYELIVWDNNSADGTKEYLKSLEGKENIRIILHPENIGTNAKGKAAGLCKGDYIFGIDDDVLSFPDNWAEKMITAYKSVPRLGYLSTDVIQNENTTGAKPPEELYTNVTLNNGEIIIQYGPAGGWCFLISREIFNKVGNFADIKGRIFFSEDGDYLNRLKNHGYKYGILKDLKVFHATGDIYNKNYMNVFNEKMKDYTENKAEEYHKKIKLQKLFNIKGMYNRFLDFAERELGKE